ncbi:MAG: hypothetical protein C0593_09125 [Marinilabiliales bacterium]|nr:MAG: hypothetical protein C0593_09125 [Marinilabiliales bacterium]
MTRPSIQLIERFFKAQMAIAISGYIASYRGGQSPPRSPERIIFFLIQGHCESYKAKRSEATMNEAI